MEMGGNSWTIWQENPQHLIFEEKVVTGVNGVATRCKEWVWGKRDWDWCETH